MKLTFPKLLTVGFSNSIIRLCNIARDSEEEVVFDLSRTTFITPFGITLLAETIFERLRRGKVVRYLNPQDGKLQLLLSKVGFNDFFSLNSSTVPQIRNTTVQLKRLMAMEPLYIQQIIDVFARDLNLSSGVKDSLKLSLNETITNVFDHSESASGCFVCAQSYGGAKNIKLCITDFGKGILASLKTNSQYRHIKDNYEAIRFAVKEGVTSRPDRLGGFGLWHILRFLKVNGGDIYIMSGNGKVRWDFKERKIHNQNMPYHFQGTIIDMKINYDKESLYF